MNKEEKIKEFLNSLPVDKDLIDYITIEESKRMNEFYSLKDRINEFFNNINYGK